MPQGISSVKRARGWIILALVVVATAVSLPATVVRATVGGLSIGPFLQEVTLEPGQAESSFSITVTNTTTTELPLRLSVVDFGAADESGGINFLPTADNLERRYGLASWMRLEKDTLVLAPNTSQRVSVAVENKESLSPGGHYGAVVFQVDNNRSSSEIQPKVNFTKAVSTLVLAKKLGGEKRSVTLSSSTWSGPPFALPREVRLRFLNNGNVHMTPKGDITITDTFNRVLSQSEINSESTIILPESFRVYPTKLADKATLWLPGWSTVTVRYLNGETGEYVTTKTSFFIATPRSVLLTGLLLVVGFMVFRYRRRSAHHIRAVARHGHVAAKKVTKKVAGRVKRKKRKQ